MKIITSLIIFFLSAVCSAELRTWTAINGKEVAAEFVSNEKGVVKLKLKSGKVFEVPLNKLSKLDQEFLKADFFIKGPTSQKDSSDDPTPLINETNAEQILNEAIDGSSGFEERDGRLYNESEPLSGWVRWDDSEGVAVDFFKDGKENGPSWGWYKNGKKAYEKMYKDGNLLVTTVWMPEGSKCPNTNFKNGNGTVYHYWDSGQKSYKGKFKEGKQDGVQTSWYENGRKAYEGTYADGKENGLHTEWHENGKKWTEVTYKDGEYNSEKFWNRKGEEVGTYEESELEDLKMISDADVERFAKNAIEIDDYEERPDYTGWWKFVHNGQLVNLVQMKNGKPDGLFMTWHDNGKIAAIARFREGGLIQEKKYYPTGEKQATRSLTKKVTWHKNGKKAHEETGSYYNGAGGADVINFWNDEGEKLEDEEGYKMLLKLSDQSEPLNELINGDLKYIIEGNSVTITGCDKKTSGALTIPTTIEGKMVTSIGSDAFGNCENLTSITIADGVTSIGDYSFNSCISLTSITIPDSVTSIGNGAFNVCRSLTSVTIPDSVISIGKWTFNDCKLTKITIPDSVTSIGDYAFNSCTDLKRILIPDSVISIGGGAFQDCKSLTNITIPDSITSIGDYAFFACESLKVVIFLGNAPKIGKGNFKDIPSTIYRKPEAKGWGDTFGGRPVKLISEKP